MCHPFFISRVKTQFSSLLINSMPFAVQTLLYEMKLWTLLSTGMRRLSTRLNGVTGQNEPDLFGTGPVHIPVMTPPTLTKIFSPSLFSRMAGQILQRWRPSVILPLYAVSQYARTVLSAIDDQSHTHISLSDFRFTGRWHWRFGTVVRTRRSWDSSSATRLWCASLNCTHRTNERFRKAPRRYR
jgi:hypothetical protein